MTLEISPETHSHGSRLGVERSLDLGYSFLIDIRYAMSRISISTFLSKAKHSLSQAVRSKGENPISLVIGNESADLDSITCAIVYGYIRSSSPSATEANKCIIPITNVPAEELRLRPELTALLKHAELKPSDLVTLDDLDPVENLHEVLPPGKTDWTLVDHNVLQGTLGKHYSQRVIGIVDHHEDEGRVLSDVKLRMIEKTGSCNSHVVNYCRDVWDDMTDSVPRPGDHSLPNDSTDFSTWDAQIAKLALGSILIDTVNLTAEEKVTDHDHKAVKYLEAKINASPKIEPAYDRDSFFKQINDAKSNLDDLTLEEILRKDYKQWTENNMNLGISSVVRSISYLQGKCKDRGDIVPALLEFGENRNLDLYAIMTAHNDNDSFERQLLLISMTDGRTVGICKQFAENNIDELQLGESKMEVNGSEAVWLRLWEQRNLAGSRKKVGPLLREAMG